MADSGAWRVGDVLAYESMREAAAELAGMLLRETNPDRDAIRAAATVRIASLEVDSHDRQAVDAAALKFRTRLNDLAGRHE